MVAEQIDTEYGSRGGYLGKFQREKLRDSQQNDKLFKEVYCCVQSKKQPRQM